MHKKVIICDLDGTLMNDERTIPEKNIQMIEDLWKEGYAFGLASGRPLDELMPKQQMWNLSRPFDVIIGMNGAELWDCFHQKEHSYFLMKKEWLKETLAIMQQWPCNPFIYLNHKIYAVKDDDLMRRSAEHSFKELVIVDSLEELYAQENAKILFRVNLEDMPKIEQYVKEHPSPNYVGYKTQPTLFEFSDKRIAKAYAMHKFCEYNNLSNQDIVAFGDTTNDIELLKYCGTGVCMCNGSPDALAVADVISDVDNNHAGVADYVYKKILKKC